MAWHKKYSSERPSGRSSSPWRLTLALLVGLMGGVGCGDDGPSPAMDGGRPADAAVRCGGAGDDDNDLISNEDEGDDDADSDGIPNREDPDSDGDGVPDIREAGDANCASAPVDTDDDGIPDYLDTDSNNDGRPDRNQSDADDSDDDGIPDRVDPDVDGDGINNVDELGADGTIVDTDMDTIPDIFDEDSDGDTISDRHEGVRDPDEDGIPAFRDLDSDDDGIDDAEEAGDSDLATPPVTCMEEIDPVTGERGGDGLPNFIDLDQDNDGASDTDERTFGTDLCDPDTDADGFSDLVEIALEQVNCPDRMTGTACGCATDNNCGVPADDFFVVLPYNGMPEQRDLDFSTEVRSGDIFFLTDTTGSMGSVLNLVKNTVATPGTGMIDRIRETIPDAWFGGGQHDDFPLGSYGGSTDEPLIRAISMTPPERSPEVQAAFNAMVLHGGGDGPESATEALFRLMTGMGETWMRDGGRYTMRNYVGDCLDGGWGAACFREGSLPIIVHFTDYCSHNGPPGESSSCNNYTGITPEPAVWGDAVRELTARGAKYIGINTRSGSRCAATVGPEGPSPCFFMKRTAEETRSIDLDGNMLVYDLPNGGGGDGAFIDQVVSAVETVATRVPLDVDTALRDDPSDAAGVDATRFIRQRQPACRAMPPTDPCWTAPAGVDQDRAVAAVDQSTFFGAIPGTAVKFRITFQNDFLPGERQAQIFIAYIDVRGSGAAILDTRQVFIVVPASPGGPVI